MGLLRLFLLLLAFPVYAGKAYTIHSQGINYDVYQVPYTEIANIHFFWKDSGNKPYDTLRKVRDTLDKKKKTLLFATNGGIYAAGYTPLGLYIENGKRYYQLSKGKGGGNFFLQPNGVFYLTKKDANVVNTTKYSPKHKVVHAVQSGPLLVENNKLHPKFVKDSKSKYLRNGVGVDKKGRVFFVISHRPVNFYSFASIFRDVLKTPNALYLDGGISSAYMPELGRLAQFQWTPFVSILGVVNLE